MSNIFLIGDTHFGHSSIIKFKRKNGLPLRDFIDINHHDEYLIYKWNLVVNPYDKVYHLGDIGFTNFTELKKVFTKLNGEKILIKGNHDTLKLSQYQQIFKDVRAYHVLDRFLLSHIPIHPESLSRWRGNIHGHLHSNNLNDSRYVNVSAEQLNDYEPVSFENIKRNF